MYNNWQIHVDYKLPTNLRNFTQKDLTEVKIFQKKLVATFLKHPVDNAV